jgi:muramoyltetrapeptide carboxypeptidase LdcA involved in peptidoglycan recycling
LGTQYDKTTEFAEKYKEDGILWFLEACDINTLSIRRAMWQMAHADWFKNVKGFLIGRPRNGESIMGLDSYKAALDVIEKYHVPVIFDVDIGHLAPMMPLVVGSKAEVTVKENDIGITMKYE